jgi:glucoamylase
MEADFDILVADYARAWEEWQRSLLALEDVEPAKGDLYRTSTMVLQVHRDKIHPGAVVASLSTPWGEAFSDKRKTAGQGGYHMDWPRDQVQIAGGLLAAGDSGAARDILGFLREAQNDDGHWPQNMWTDGKPFWTGSQLGETAAPILLADLMRREGALDDSEFDSYWPMVRKAACYVLHHGPSTQEERWEDEPGFNPYTIGALIASMLIAAEMAERRGEGREAAFLRETADAWYSSIDYWTYVNDSRLARRIGVPGYYLRIAPTDRWGEPSKHDDHLNFWYQEPRIKRRYPPAAIVSPDALAYVRFGLRAPDDPRIVATMKVVDAVTKVETPCGPAWHRYNHDGYGEQTDGSPFDGKHGHGRAWPLLAAERAHVELAAGRRDEAVSLLRAVQRFAGEGGMIPEQVWDTYGVPERGLHFGRPSGSAMPLAWAHAEYVKLRRSLRDDRIFDLPPQTVQRYLVDRLESPRVLWRLDHRRRAFPAGKVLRIELPGPAVIRWEGGADGRQETPTRDSGLGLHYVDLPTEAIAAGEDVLFTIDRVGSDWSRKQAAAAAVSRVVRIEGPVSRPRTKGGRSPAAILAAAEQAVIQQ